MAEQKARRETRRPLIAGNWKMNLGHLEAIHLVQKLAFTLTEKHLEHVDVTVLPPFTSLRSVQSVVDGDKLLISYGAQDLSPHEKGAHTGDISGGMLAKLGCSYVLAGHSERRQHHQETDELVNAKVKAALKHEITPILCVGEGLEVREAGEHVAHCVSQLDGALKGVKVEQLEQIVVAYEPVWAIGTGKTATPEDAQEVIGALRARIAERRGSEVAEKVRILYGGSVKGSNIAGIMAKPDIDGALVGGASLDPDDFALICCYREHFAVT
ncbi:MAG: triose-phosphate isomerase [Micromonosporaceae bacterium]